MKLNQQLKSRIGLFFCTYILFVLFFVVGKIIFFLFQYANNPFSIGDYLSAIWSGLPMDLSMAGYLVTVPILIFIISSFWIRGLKSVLAVFFGLIVVVIALTVVADAELYSFWGFRIDATVFTYLSSPKEAVASISVGRLLFLLLLIVGYSVLEYFILKKLILKNFPSEKGKKKILTTALFIPVLGLTFVAIRGGVTTSTMNVGKVYFSDVAFLNHSAINPLFNIMYSLSHMKEDFDSKYHFMDMGESERLFAEMMEHDAKADTVKLLNTERPDIIFIILESFGARIVEPLGGEKGVAPNLNKLTEEGILFSKMYANSFRTDRGVVSVLGGYPAQPTMSILKYPSKVETLNSIPKTLYDNGYNTSFMYGGDIHFANVSTFLLSQKITNITRDADFPIKDILSKWGAPDHVTFEALLKDVEKETKSPSFKSLLTLSSHEPFDVPCNRFEDPYLNSVAYSDSCLGVFIDKLKQSPKWKNTLVVLVPDHDMRYPSVIDYFGRDRHDIFMLWLGGAVEKPLVVEKLCSQTDITATLLSQLNIDYSQFEFSRNIMNPTYNEFSFYAFPDGFGVVAPDGHVIYDNMSKTVLEQSGSISDSLLLNGKAYLQYLYHDISKR